CACCCLPTIHGKVPRCGGRDGPYPRRENPPACPCASHLRVVVPARPHTCGSLSRSRSHTPSPRKYRPIAWRSPATGCIYFDRRGSAHGSPEWDPSSNEGSGNVVAERLSPALEPPVSS